MLGFLTRWFHRKRQSRRRVPGAVRGRLYDRPDESPRAAGRTRSRPVARIKARVQRAGSEEWEDLGTIAENAEVRRTPNGGNN